MYKTRETGVIILYFKMLILCIFPLLLLAKLSTGGQTYNAFSHICCNGTLFERPNITEYISYCCGNKLLQYRNNIHIEESIIPRCCDKTLYEKGERTFQCCGNILYNASANICFQYKTVIPIPINKLATKFCGNDAHNVTFYNPTEQLCCFGLLYKKENGLRCCNDTVHNISTSACCGNTIVPNENLVGKNCCGNKLYDPSEAKCCAFESKPTLESWSNSPKYIEVLVEYNGMVPLRAQCCRSKLYDYETQVCCPGGPVEQPNNYQFSYGACCGKELITNWTQQLCVGGVFNGKIVQRSHKNEAVCNDKIYDMKKYYCYNDILIERKLNQKLCFC